MCSNSFTCLTEIHIVGTQFVGYQWFFIMIFVAFWLQIAANFVWLKTSQLSREILKAGPKSKWRMSLIYWSDFWTGISTLIWILRVVLVIGNNLWIFIVILLGNITGKHWALTIQEKDLYVEKDTSKPIKKKKNKLVL